MTPRETIKRLDQTAIARIINDVGTEARRRINRLPEGERETAWACVAAAIVGAAVHDTGGSDRVLNIIEAAKGAMLVALAMGDAKPPP